MKNIIHIRQGLGDIRFDMPIEEVVSILGHADDVENVVNAFEETTTIMHYNEGELNLFLEGENPTLQCIDISSDDCLLFDKSIFDLDEKAIVRLMVDNKYFEEDVDEESWGERRVTFNEANIDFFFDQGELTAVAFGK